MLKKGPEFIQVIIDKLNHPSVFKWSYDKFLILYTIKMHYIILYQEQNLISLMVKYV